MDEFNDGESVIERESSSKESTPRPPKRPRSKELGLKESGSKESGPKESGPKESGPKESSPLVKDQKSTDQDKLKHTCQTCNKSFSYQFGLKKHHKSSPKCKEIDDKEESEDDSGEFSEEEQEPMEKVTKEVTKEITTYKCDACHVILMTKKALENHKTFHCQAEEPEPENTCPTCRKTFSSNRNLKDHVRKLHPPEDGPFFDCDKCHYRSRIKAYFKDHVRRVHDKRGF